MQILESFKHRKVYKRGIAFLLAVMVLLSAVDMLMFSVMANGTVYSGESYTLTTTGINFRDNSGNVLYTFKRRKPVYTYTLASREEPDGQGGTVTVPYIKKEFDVTATENGDEWVPTELVQRFTENNEPVTQDGYNVYDVKEDSGEFYVEDTAINIGTALDDYTSVQYAVIDSWNDDGTDKMTIIKKDGDNWVETTVKKNTFTQQVPRVDENGDPVYQQEVDENGDPVYEQAVDENGEPVVDGEGNPVYDYTKPVYVQTTDPDTGNLVYVQIVDDVEVVVWEEITPDDTAAANEFPVTVTSPGAVETSTIKIVCPTELQATLLGETSTDNALLFMSKANETVEETAKTNGETFTFDSTNRTKDTVVQASNPQTRQFRKKWQDNGADKSDLTVNMGVKYDDYDNTSTVLIDAAPAVVNGQKNRTVNSSQRAAFYRSDYPEGAPDVNSVYWDYILQVNYLYNYNYDESDKKVSPRYFHIFEQEIPTGYIQTIDNDGNLINIKIQPYVATVQWNDASNKYTTRPEPQDLLNNIKGLVYKKSGDNAEEKIDFDDAAVLYRETYKPLKEKIPYLPYQTVYSSDYMTQDYIDEYNNRKTNEYNQYVANDDVNGYNTDTVSIKNAAYGTATVASTFNETEPNTWLDPVQYNLKVDEYNRKVAQYNAEVEAFNNARMLYNEGDETHEGVAAHNARINDLINNTYRNDEKIIVVEPKTDNTWTITMPHAMGVDSDNNTYAYYIKQNGNDFSKNLVSNDCAEGIDPSTDEYKGSITNAGNYAAIDNALYTGGTAELTLSGTTDFRVYKYWGDNAVESRPTYKLAIYHYADGKSYISGTPLDQTALNYAVDNDTRDANDELKSRGEAITEYYFTVDGSADSSNEVDVLNSKNITVPVMPKFDPAGYIYVYYAREIKVMSSSYSYSTSRDTSHENSPYQTNESFPNNYALNGDMLKNVLSGGTGKTVTKTWKAESRQDRSDSATFVIDQYKYILDSNNNYIMENYKTGEEVTSQYEKMYVLYEMVEDGGIYKYKLQVNYIDPVTNVNYTGYALYTPDQIYIDPVSQEVYVKTYTYTDNEGNVQTKTAASGEYFTASFAERYLDDIYKRDENGSRIQDSNGNWELDCREEELKRTLTTTGATDSNGRGLMAFTNDSRVRVLEKTSTDHDEYLLYSKKTDNSGHYVYELNKGGTIITRYWNQIYNIDTENGTAYTTEEITVPNKAANDAILKEAILEEIAQWKADNNYDSKHSALTAHISDLETYINTTLPNAKSAAQSSKETWEDSKSTAQTNKETWENTKTQYETAKSQAESNKNQAVQDKANDTQIAAWRAAKISDVQDLQNQKTQAANDLNAQRQQAIRQLNDHKISPVSEYQRQLQELNDQYDAAIAASNAHYDSLITAREEYYDGLIAEKETYYDDLIAGYQETMDDCDTHIAECNTKIQQYADEMVSCQTQIDHYQAIIDECDVNLAAAQADLTESQAELQALEDELTAEETAVNEKTINDYIGKTITLNGDAFVVAVQYTTSYKEILVKLVYTTANYIHYLNDDRSETNTILPRYEYVSNEGRVVWLDNDTSLTVDGIQVYDEANKDNASTPLTLTVSRPKYLNGTSGQSIPVIPKTRPVEGHYNANYVVDGFSQDVTSKTVTLDMPKYDGDGYEYVYKIYEGSARTKDEAPNTYADSVPVVDKTGSYRIFTTDKGYQYESRETIENGSSIVVNKLIGDTYLQTTKGFMGDFSQYAGDKVIVYNIYRDGRRIGSANMYFHIDAHSGHDHEGKPITWSTISPIKCTTNAPQDEHGSYTLYVSKDNFFVNENLSAAETAEILEYLENQIESADYADVRIPFPRYNDSGASYNYEILESGMYGVNSFSQNADGKWIPDINYRDIVDTSGNESLSVEEHEVGDQYNSDYAYMVVRDSVTNIIGDGDAVQAELDVYKEYRDENQDLYRRTINATVQYCTGVVDGVAQWKTVTANEEECTLGETFSITPYERFREYQFTKEDLDGDGAYKGTVLVGDSDSQGMGYDRYVLIDGTEYPVGQTRDYYITYPRNSTDRVPVTFDDFGKVKSVSVPVTYNVTSAEVDGATVLYLAVDGTNYEIKDGTDTDNNPYKYIEFKGSACAVTLSDDGTRGTFTRTYSTEDNRFYIGSNSYPIHGSTFKYVPYYGYMNGNKPDYSLEPHATGNSIVIDRRYQVSGTTDNLVVVIDDVQYSVYESNGKKYIDYPDSSSQYEVKTGALIDGKIYNIQTGTDGESNTYEYVNLYATPAAETLLTSVTYQRIEYVEIPRTYAIQENVLLVDELQEWLWMRKIAYRDDLEELQAQYPGVDFTNYDPENIDLTDDNAVIYYYNDNYSEARANSTDPVYHDGSVKKFITWQEIRSQTEYQREHPTDDYIVGSIAAEDRIDIKCSDKEGNFRVVEVSVKDTNSTSYVEHEDRLTATKLLTYLKNNKDTIFDFVKSYANESTTEQAVKDRIAKWNNDLTAFEADVNYFLNTHGDTSTLNWIKNYVTDNNIAGSLTRTYYDLAPLLKDIFKNYLGTLTAEELADFCQYYAGKESVARPATLDFIATLSADDFEKCVKDYYDYVLDRFCEAHLEHHRGNSFVQTVDQNYDVTPYAEVRFPVVNETKTMFQFGLVNTRVGAQQMTITKNWADGENASNTRPNAVEYVITSTHPVFDSFTDEQLAEMNMERIQATDDDGNLVYEEDGVTPVYTPYRVKVRLTGTDNSLTPNQWYYDKAKGLPKYTFELPSYRSITNTPDEQHQGRTDFTAEGYGDRTDGTAISYSISETAYISILNGDEESWEFSSSNTALNPDRITTYTRGGGLDSKHVQHPNPNNHTGDIYPYVYSGTVSGVADLVANKYWMDSDNSSTANVRPNMDLIVYRSYTYKNENTGEKRVKVERVGQLGTDWQGQNTDDSKWWKILYINGEGNAYLPKYTGQGYLINYYIMEETTTVGTQYKDTETFVGEPSISYVEYNDKKYYTTRYDGQDYVMIDSVKYPVQRYQSVKVGSVYYQVVNGKAYNTSNGAYIADVETPADGSPSYIAIDGKKYYLANSTNRTIVNIDGMDYVVQNGKITYENADVSIHNKQYVMIDDKKYYVVSTATGNAVFVNNTECPVSGGKIVYNNQNYTVYTQKYIDYTDTDGTTRYYSTIRNGQEIIHVKETDCIVSTDSNNRAYITYNRKVYYTSIQQCVNVSRNYDVVTSNGNQVVKINGDEYAVRTDDTANYPNGYIVYDGQKYSISTGTPNNTVVIPYRVYDVETSNGQYIDVDGTPYGVRIPVTSETSTVPSTIDNYDEIENKYYLIRPGDELVSQEARVIKSHADQMYYFIEYNSDIYDFDYNANTKAYTVALGGNTYPVQNYKSVTVVEKDDNDMDMEVTYEVIGNRAGNYTVQGSGTDKYVEKDGQKYYLHNSTTRPIVNVDGIDCVVSDNMITYNGNQYAVTTNSSGSQYVTIIRTYPAVTKNGNPIVQINGVDYDIVQDTTEDENGTVIPKSDPYITYGSNKYYVNSNNQVDITRQYPVETSNGKYVQIGDKLYNVTAYKKVAPFVFDTTTGKYNQGTIVNRPLSDRDISGKKTWKYLPNFNSGAYDASLLPDMTLTMYRYSYDEIAAMQQHDEDVDNNGSIAAEDKESNKLLKPAAGETSVYDRKYPKSVDTEHLVRYSKINADETGEPVADSTYTVNVSYADGTPMGTLNVSRAVTAKIQQKQGEFVFNFEDDEGKKYQFDWYDNHGKPYTYVLHEGYITTVEVWQYKDGENPDTDKGVRVFTSQLDESRENIVNLTADLPKTYDDNGTVRNYQYVVKQVDGTEALDESYTFAYELTQSDENGIEITNLYNKNQSLAIKLKKVWTGLPENLSPSDYPTTTFKLVRYLQDYNGKIAGTDEDVTFTEDEFHLQEYITLGDERVFLENKQLVKINNYPKPYQVTNDGTRLVYNEMTEVHNTDGQYVVLGGIRYDFTGDSLTIGNDTYNTFTDPDTGKKYITIPIQSADERQYVVIDNKTVYAGSDGTVTINGTSYIIDDDHLAYDTKTRIDPNAATFTFAGKTYNVAESNGTKYVQMAGEKYNIVASGGWHYVNIDVRTPSKKYIVYENANYYVSRENNVDVVKIGTSSYTVHHDSDGDYLEYNTQTKVNNNAVTIGGKSYTVQTDDLGKRYVAIGNENYPVVTSGSDEYVRIDVRALLSNKYVSLNYKQYSVYEDDEDYYARIGEQYYDIQGSGNDRYIALPVATADGRQIVVVNGVDYEVTNGKVTINDKEYSVVADGTESYMKVPIQASVGYVYNYHKNSDNEIVSVDVTYMGNEQSEIELRWSDLPYYAPNMYPYIYNIEELGVTDGFSVRSLPDEYTADYANNAENGQSTGISNVRTNEDSTSEIHKSDYVTELALNATKKDKTSVNVGLENKYGDVLGAVKVQNHWQKDLEYKISPRPEDIEVTLYRSMYQYYVGNEPVLLQQYVIVDEQKYFVDTTINGDGSVTQEVTIGENTYTVDNESGRITVDGKTYPLQHRQDHIVVDGTIVNISSIITDSETDKRYAVIDGTDYEITNNQITYNNKNYDIKDCIDCVKINGKTYQLVGVGEKNNNNNLTGHVDYGATKINADNTITIGNSTYTVAGNYTYGVNNQYNTVVTVNGERYLNIGIHYLPYMVESIYLIDNNSHTNTDVENIPYQKDDLENPDGTNPLNTDFTNNQYNGRYSAEDYNELPVTAKTYTLSGGTEGADWKYYIIDNLQRYSPSGKKYYYYAVHKSPDGYWQSGFSRPVEALAPDNTTSLSGYENLNITHITDTTIMSTATAKKTWKDDHDEAWSNESMLFASKLSGIAKNITYRLAYSTTDYDPTRDDYTNAEWSDWQWLETNSSYGIDIDGYWYDLSSPNPSTIRPSIRLTVKKEEVENADGETEVKYYVEDETKHYITLESTDANDVEYYSVTAFGSSKQGNWAIGTWDYWAVHKSQLTFYPTLTVKSDAADSTKKYVEYWQDGVKQIRYISAKYAQKTMSLTQTVENGEPVAEFKDIYWQEGYNDRLPQYIRVNEDDGHGNTVSKLKVVRYMPVEYALMYTKDNYEDDSQNTGIYTRNDNGVTDEQILAALNSSADNLHDTFQMGFVTGTADYQGTVNTPSAVLNDGTTVEFARTVGQSHTTNTVRRQKITVIKDWGDDYNRDQLRGDFTLQFKITRKNINYLGDKQEVVVALTQDDAYQYTDNNNEEQTNPNIWVKSYYVPVTSNFDSSVLSEYTVEELGPVDDKYQVNFAQYTHKQQTGIDDGNLDVQNLSAFNYEKGTLADVGNLTDRTTPVENAVAVDRYAAFNNHVPRQEMTLTPSKLWYMVETEQYPKTKDNAKVKIPDWVKNIFFPDGNPDNLRIRFKLEYQILDDDKTVADLDENGWKAVTDTNEDYPNVSVDLANVEPYLEFKIDKYGDINPIRNGSWTNLPKHYLTNNLDEHANYYYRIKEILVRDIEDVEVPFSAFYVQLNSGNTYLSALNGGVLESAVHTDTNGYVYLLSADGDKYYIKADKDGNTNYVVKKADNKYYIAKGTEYTIDAEKDFDIAYDNNCIDAHHSEGVTIDGTKYYVDHDTETNTKTITIGEQSYGVTSRNYIQVDGNRCEVTYNSSDKKYYAKVNNTDVEVTITGGMVHYNSRQYELLSDEYITYNSRRYYLESVEEIQTTNTVNKTKASVEKTWDDNDNLYSTRPQAIMYELQYRPQDGSEEWKNVEQGWIFDVYSVADVSEDEQGDDEENQNDSQTKVKLDKSAYEYKSVSEDNAYFKFDGDKYDVLTDAARKYVEINGEKLYIETNNANSYLKLDGRTIAYDGTAHTITVGEYAVQTAPDGSGDYILINGDRIYAVSNQIVLNSQNTSAIANGKVTVTLNVKSETAPMNVIKKNDNKYYYTVNGVDKEVTAESLYIQTASNSPKAVYVQKDANNKVTVTKTNDNKLTIKTYKNASYTDENVKAVVQSKNNETFYIRVPVETAKILIDKLPSADAKNRLLEYRFVESYLDYGDGNYMPLENGRYVKTETSQKTTLDNDEGIIFETAVSNELPTTSLKITKTWGEDMYRMSTNVKTITFEIQRRVKTSDKDGGTYTAWETLSGYKGDTQPEITMSWTDGTVQSHNSTFNGTTGWTDLPKYDTKNREYEYRAVEKSITPDGENAQAVPVIGTTDSGANGSVGGFNYTSTHSKTWNGTAVTNYNSTLTNVPVVSKLAVTKEWVDDHDRDNPRPDRTLTIKATLADGETDAGITLPEGTETISVANYYTQGQSADTSKAKAQTQEGNVPITSYNNFYPDNYYYVWYKLPIKNVNGERILYTITQDGTEYYSAETRVTDWSVSGENMTTYDGYGYTLADGTEADVTDETVMYIVVDETPVPVTVNNDGKLTATVNETAVTAEVEGAERMYIPVGDKRYYVMTEIDRSYVEIGGSKVYVQTDDNGSYITLDGTRCVSDGTQVTVNGEYPVTADTAGDYITVNGRRIDIADNKAVINGQTFNVTGEGNDRKVTVANLTLKLKDPVPVYPKTAFIQQETDGKDKKISASTYLRETEVTPEYSPSVFSDSNLSKALVYDPDNDEAMADTAKEYSQLDNVTRIDFRDIYIPRTVNIKAVKHWIGDNDHDSGVWKNSRPPQGVIYTIQYRRVNTTEWHNIPFQPSDTVAAQQAWKNVYDELDETTYEAVNVVGAMEYDENDEPIYDNTEGGWDLTWDNLPIYERNMVGVEFEYRVIESQNPYPGGRDGLYNYVTTYGGVLNNGGTSEPQVLTAEGDISEENIVLTEDIYNTLRTAFVKKLIDPDYIGTLAQKPELYEKEFNFEITVTDTSGNVIPTLMMQKTSDGTSENISLTDGKTAKISLKHGDEISLYNIPANGMRYSVTEDDYYTDGFNAYVSVDDGQEVKQRTVSGVFDAGQHSILYTNRVIPLPSTGGSGIGMFIEIALGFITAGAAIGFIYWLSRRSKMNEELSQYVN